MCYTQHWLNSREFRQLILFIWILDDSTLDCAKLTIVHIVTDNTFSIVANVTLRFHYWLIWLQLWSLVEAASGEKSRWFVDACLMNNRNANQIHMWMVFSSLSVLMTRRKSLLWKATRTEPGWVRASPNPSSQQVQRKWRKMVETGPRGTLRSSTCWPRWGSVWAWGMCGGSRTFATKMEEVSGFKERAVKYNRVV